MTLKHCRPATVIFFTEPAGADARGEDSTRTSTTNLLRTRNFSGRGMVAIPFGILVTPPEIVLLSARTPHRETNEIGIGIVPDRPFRPVPVPRKGKPQNEPNAPHLICAGDPRKSHVGQTAAQTSAKQEQHHPSSNRVEGSADGTRHTQ